jgi:two-component system NtrC family sensor kinase
MKMNSKWFLIFIIIFLNAFNAFSDNIIIKDANSKLNIGRNLEYYIDATKKLTINAVENRTDFIRSVKAVPNFGVGTYAIWIKFTIHNTSADERITLQIDHPVLDDISLYTKTKNGFKVDKQGEAYQFSKRIYNDPSFMFTLDIPIGQTLTYYLRIESTDNIQLPIFVGNEKTILENSNSKLLISGLYLGVMLSMLLYNLFIYFTVRDNSYLYYVVYLILVILTQASIQGFTFKYLWPENSALAIYSSFIFPPLVGISGLQFERHFLKTKEWLPKADSFSFIFILLYLSSIVLALFSEYNLAFKLIELTASTVSIFMFYMAVKISLKGYRPATFFLISWSVFLVGIIIYTLKDFGILPYNNFTYYTMPFGSALEVTLLSFALADKINTYRKEKEESQEQALRISIENEKLILEQNIELEKKVNERTLELQDSNTILEVTLNDLKEAQSQLVDSEKMASLGQLTAGIAHEINNPINFVTSNIKPLELDIDDLYEVINQYENLDLTGDVGKQISNIESFKKQIDISYVREEIKSLLSGIGEGAKRTAEIIRSLKNFSRLDENDTKPVDLNEGLDSTLVLIKNTFPGYLKVVKSYGILPEVECLPGKINQVFMNLITNAVQAVESKPEHNLEEYIKISTWKDNDTVKISIGDSGTGMPEEVKQKIFEPFFTTKDVGEGTGLGLSIVFRIIESHNGTIEVNTNVNEGTEFIITLPINNR